METVYAVDAETGELLWTSREAQSSDRIPSDQQGAVDGAQSPGELALGDGRLYVVNSHGDLVALETNSGDLVWSFNVLERFDVSLPVIHPITVDGNLLVHVSAAQYQGDDLSTIVLLAALNPIDGQELWSLQFDGYNSISTLAGIDRIVLSYTNNSDEFGIIIVGVQSGEIANAIVYQTPIDHVTGMTFADETLYLASQGGILQRLDLEAFDDIWHFSTGQGTMGDPIVTDDLVIVECAGPCLIALDKSSPAMQAEATPTS